MEKPLSHAKMRLQSAPRKRKFVVAKPKAKYYTLVVAANALARSRKVMYDNTASFLIKKSILCETNNISFSKNC